MGSRDPTRSQGLRREGRGKVTRKVFELNRNLRQVMQDGDVAGLRPPPVPWSNWNGSTATRLARSEMMARGVINNTLLMPPDWLSNLIERAVSKGVEQAAQELKTELAGLDLGSVNEVHTFAAINEVTGIANETTRRTMRHIGDAMERKQTPEALMRELRGMLEKITKLRLNLLVNTSVVRAVNAGKLAAYKDQGVRQVGVMPEWMPAPKQHDHAVQDERRLSSSDVYPESWESESAFMLRCERELGDEDECALIWGIYTETELKPKARRTAKKQQQQQQAKAKAQKKATKKKEAAKKAEAKKSAKLSLTAPANEFSAAVLVNVLTAGDDRVCDDCDQIAAQGPYDLEEAQGLIPSHPNCRCAFVPYGDARFAPIAEQEE